MKTAFYAIFSVAAMLMLVACKSETGLKPRLVRIFDFSQAVDTEMGERLRDYAQSQLGVKVALENAVRETNMMQDAIDNAALGEPISILLCDCPNDNGHIAVDSDRGLAAINIAALKCKDQEKFARRIERLIMRSAGSLAGLGFDPDPFCVMHSYKTVEDLDGMGRNFSPPWQMKFMQSAKEMGLETIGSR